ncbi:MAG: hypothetical protein ISS95_00100 [Candidatus Aenigmarchaeota archaeon]|nr:hypothetical protein [Candidatus Aenigmarchaeota archaeon]
MRNEESFAKMNKTKLGNKVEEFLERGKVYSGLGKYINTISLTNMSDTKYVFEGETRKILTAEEVAEKLGLQEGE